MAVAAAVLTWSNANAISITDYNTAASLEGALSSYSTEDFSSSVLNPGVSVTTVNGQVTGGLWADRVVPNTASTTWAFSSAITAWGADFDFTPGGPGTGINVTLDLYGGSNILAHAILNPGSGQAFVGFYGLVSSVPFDHVVLTAGSQPGGVAETYNMDNMIYGNAGNVVTLNLSNVRAVQRTGTKLVDIFYDLASSAGSPLAVSVAVSTNNGTSFNLTATSFFGSGYGSSVTPGNNRHVIWDAGADWNGQLSSKVVFNITAAGSISGVSSPIKVDTRNGNRPLVQDVTST
jgi:hypothetical protein